MIGYRLGATAAFLLFAAAPAAAFAPPSADKALSNPTRSKKAAEPDVERDPAVRFGTLPNGFRYAVMQNKSPAGSVSIRLLVRVGSYDEADDELDPALQRRHVCGRLSGVDGESAGVTVRADVPGELVTVSADDEAA